jgi:hypothetical protein
MHFHAVRSRQMKMPCGAKSPAFFGLSFFKKMNTITPLI